MTDQPTPDYTTPPLKIVGAGKVVIGQAAEHAAGETELDHLSQILPSTFYADRPLAIRLEFMASGWRKAVQAAGELQIQLTQEARDWAEFDDLLDTVPGVPKSADDYRVPTFDKLKWLVERVTKAEAVNRQLREALEFVSDNVSLVPYGFVHRRIGAALSQAPATLPGGQAQSPGETP